ncbi:MAG: hypothetical protein K9L78_00440 [Victivallales bacterium]|nr:hypothetical protein [Victivallales bacterium]MCF7888563.1 hypothetical protein [Victivallales bacterium]
MEDRTNRLKSAIKEGINEEEGKKYLTCGKAHQISKKQNITLKELGNYCNQNGIKIIKCQLGCF